ncbi:MAG: VOC family protein [Sphingomonadales bacterium]|nr:VOC family protein [Sphingomonadales bacterium]
MALGVQGIHHIGISVPDLARAREFFIDLLGGIEEVAPFGWRDNPFIDSIVGLPGSAADQFLCRLGNAHLEVFEYHAPSPAPQDPERGVHNLGYTHFALQVDDIAACCARLRAAGIRLHAEPELSGITRHPDGRITGYAATYCRDWFGNVFEIMEIHDCEDMPRV